MEAKEKAEELVNRFKSTNVSIYYNNDGLTFVDGTLINSIAVEYAMILADEIISQWEYIDTYLADLNGELNPNLKYWYSVKEELLKMK
ncbi:hypothetical protein [Elizabethkingia anophelis]|uniref:hypothetical protein n=1 Tax=Elizabethkingia anophelis TaxID=1117645 RepID=UPI00075151FD|nr:hypothetical protein [Elizabethkingia anophelis]AQW91320.1 hypothetical protein BBD28_11930 [Elizabethkingia anophelis]KUY14186.1 hypothetical protein ATB94_09310 [Elizabethkingia anophelis]